MDDYVFVDTINIALFEKEKFNPAAEENAHVLEHMKTTVDGKILAVKRDKVASIAKESEVFLIRMGMKKMPKQFDIKSEDDFWRFMAHLVDVDEDL